MRLVSVFPALVCACAALSAGSHRTRWEVKEFTWVKLEPREKGAPACEHPAVLDPVALRGRLAELKAGDEALFEAKELDALVKPLVEAFAGAEAGEDLVLLSTNRRGGGFMNPAFAVAARLWVEGGQVNMIVHDTRLDFLDRYRVEHLMPTFTYGSRTEAGKVKLAGAGFTFRRADWVAFPATRAAAPAVVAVPAAPVLAPAPAPAPKAVPADTQENRLRTLKRLRDENLITEEEYQKKRKEILEAL